MKSFFKGRSTQFWLAFVVFISSNQAFAQSRAPDEYPGRSAMDLLTAYQGQAGTMKGKELLIGVLNKKMPLTDENLKATRNSLAKARDQEEKILLIQVLASLYGLGARNEQKRAIESDIRGYVYGGDLRVAAEAVIAYSRMGNPPDLYHVLQRAHGNRIIKDDVYFRELAFALRFSSSADQSQMISELERANNDAANETLAFIFGNPDFVGQLTANTQSRLLKLQYASEPGFPMALDSFGLLDQFRYTYWINSVATIELRLNKKPYAQTIIERLSNPDSDPRKILAVFSKLEGKRVIKETGNTEQLRPLLERAQIYSHSLPGNEMAKGALALFTNQLAAGDPRGADAITK